MKLNDIQYTFNRALSLTFSKKKLLLVSLILALCGILVVFCRGLAVYANQWTVLSLTFIPIFLCAGVLLSTGILLIRVYHDEVKSRPVTYSTVLAKSWEIIIGASYFAIPIILSYLLLWMLLGIFVLMKEIPGIGEFFVAILAFAPFLLNLGALVLCVLSLLMLYFIAPVVALKGINRLQIANVLVTRLKSDVFSNMVLGFVALIPLIFFTLLLSIAAFLTGSVCFTCANPIQNVVQWFFIMIPFVALLSPAVVFFFNYAAEAHVLIMRDAR